MPNVPHLLAIDPLSRDYRLLDQIQHFIDVDNVEPSALMFLASIVGVRGPAQVAMSPF